MRTLLATAAIVAVAGAAEAQEGADAALSGDRIENQAMTVTADPDTEGPRTADGDVTKATERAREIAEEKAREDEKTGMTEAATGDAAPTENWFGCEPDAADQEDGACQPGSAEIEGASTTN